MPCPFGFAPPADGEVEEDVSSETENEEASKKKQKLLDSDHPGAWFFQHQHRIEQEYVQKVKEKKDKSRRRLDEVMLKKGKKIIWPEKDREVDKASIHSSEISDLDSDVNSIQTLRTCARSWIEDVKYREKGAWMMGICIALAAVAAAYCAYNVHELTEETARHPKSVIKRTWLPYLYVAAASYLPLAVLARLATKWRSKRTLLATQILGLAIYSAWAAAICVAVMYPVVVNPKSMANACKKNTTKASLKRHCKSLTQVEVDLVEATWHIVVSASTSALTTLMAVGAGFWYRFEIYYLEKRATSHKRRHRRRKHRIPWEKIKLIGPVLNCGAGGGGGGGGGGKCPFGH